VLDHRLLADGIDGEDDLVTNAVRFDLDRAGLAVQDEWHRHQRLDGVTLRAAAGRDVGFTRTDTDAEIEDVADDVGRQAGAVVGDGDSRLVDTDGDLRHGAGFLAGVERVVDQLLQDDQRPVTGLVTGLRDQLLATAEIEQPARLKGGSRQMVSALCRLSRGRGGRQVHRHHLTRPRQGRPTWRASVRPR
jgi:hypothetical protein